MHAKSGKSRGVCTAADDIECAARNEGPWPTRERQRIRRSMKTTVALQIVSLHAVLNRTIEWSEQSGRQHGGPGEDQFSPREVSS
jgi:hypothetical protein